MFWIDYRKEKPKPKKNEVIYALVELEHDGKKEYHVATFHKNLITVGGHFGFDMPPIIKWIPINEILNNIKDKENK
jgi:hypothetical protein